MYAVEVYATVRQLVFAEGLSRREVARRLGLSRDTVRKMCRFSEPPGYRRTKAAERLTSRHPGAVWLPARGP